MTLPVLTTARLTIRPLRLDDLDAFAAIFADAETMAASRRTYSREESRGWIERSLMRYERDGFALFAVGHLSVSFKQAIAYSRIASGLEHC